MMREQSVRRRRDLRTPAGALVLAFGVAMGSCGDAPGTSPVPDPEDAGTHGLGPDGASIDASLWDASVEDAALEDADASGGQPDAQNGSPDGAADAGCQDELVVGPLAATSSTPPSRLFDTGLYEDPDTKRISRFVKVFEPRFPLWSDGSEKTRWIHLPPCTTIETIDLDYWSFPAGTRVWKEFRINERRIETRVITRFGTGPNDFSYAAYLWNEDETDALHVPAGEQNALGTEHDVPPLGQCLTCHEHLSSRVLGFDAVQLSHDGAGLTLAQLISQGRLSHPPEAPYTPPGDDLSVKALGYLHANCGNCHHEGTRAVPFVQAFSLRLSVGDTTVAGTGAIRTSLDKPLEKFHHPDIRQRITAADPVGSAVVARMADRGSADQMPPVGSKRVDFAGLADIEEWIFGL